MEISSLVLLKPVMGAWNWLQSQLGVSRDHDIAVFRKLDAIANEAKLDDIINRGIYNRRTNIDESHLLADFTVALQRIENRYLDRALQKRVQAFILEMHKLQEIVNATFFSTGAGRLKFRPEFVDPRVFEAEWDEVVKTIEGTWNSYLEYRLAIKKRLKV